MKQGRILEKNALLEIPQDHPFFFKKYYLITPLLSRTSRGLPRHDIMINWIKEVPDENELIFGGTDLKRLIDGYDNIDDNRGFFSTRKIGAFYGRSQERNPGNEGLSRL